MIEREAAGSSASGLAGAVDVERWAGYAGALVVAAAWLAARPAAVDGVPFAIAFAGLVAAAVAGWWLVDVQRSGVLVAALFLISWAGLAVAVVVYPRPGIEAAVGGVAFGALGAAIRARHRIDLGSMLLLSAFAAAWAIEDLQILLGPTHHLYDIGVYLGSASRWAAGGNPYLTAPLTVAPASPGADFFLYPPPLLPVFAVLGRLPETGVVGVWVALLFAANVVAVRALGASWPWSLALACSPFAMTGVDSGNVASLTFLAFALGGRMSDRAGAPLPVLALFKVQSAIPALWLVRERRWRALVAGAAVVAGLCLVTLPVVGVAAWRGWVASLGYRAATQANIPHLYGASLAATWPGWLFAAVSVASIAAALALRGRRSLSGLGLAAIVSSPSLWAHGFVFATPAVLTIERGAIVLVVLAIAPLGGLIWLPVVAGAIALAVAPARTSGDVIHPLGDSEGPWAEARAEAAGAAEP